MMQPTEHEVQCTVIDWARWNEKRFPELWFLHAIPNGGQRNKAVAKKLKDEGVKAGVSDLFLPVARRGYHGLYIEMKTVGGRISDAQAEWINRVRKQGYAAFICHSSDEAIEKLEWYLTEIERGFNK